MGAGRQLGAAAAAASCRPGERGHKNSGLPRLANTHYNPVKIFKLYNNVLQSAVRCTEGPGTISVASPPGRCSSTARLAVQPDGRQLERDFPAAAQWKTARVTWRQAGSTQPPAAPPPSLSNVVTAQWRVQQGCWRRTVFLQCGGKFVSEDRCQPPGAQYYPTLFLYPQQEQLNPGLDKQIKLRLSPDSAFQLVGISGKSLRA